MPAFDLVVAVDWSAAVTPVTGADSIWVATSDGLLANPPTRVEAAAVLAATVGACRGRVLVGVDVPFGYPAGTSAILGLAGTGWRAMWHHLAATVTDDDRNRNDRFAVVAALNRRAGLDAGPFWGCPSGLRLDALAPTKPAFSDVSEWRACERALRARRLWPCSVWQVAYAGSVGGQAITAIPVLERMRAGDDRVEVWPFTTEFVEPAGLRRSAVVLAEVWPSAFAVDRSRHPVKDAAQVLHVVDVLAAADRDGALARWFTGTRITDADRAAALAEEGWILTPPGPP